jgi:BirA family biotin operon repressor/biotin-[acetyl-CoA-carboxylase] ligase
LTAGSFCGVMVTMQVSGLSVPEINAALETSWLGRQVVYHSCVGSTNDEAKGLAEVGAPEGTLVIADYQTAGRGRLDRLWWSPPGSGLLLSLIFRPTFLMPQQAQRVAMVCSLAVCDAVAEVTGLAAAIKWPNDVLIEGRKVGGLLTELGIAASRLDHVVVGIGVNVNVEFEGSGAPALMAPATSLRAELGSKVSRLTLLAALLRCVEARYERLRAGVLPHDEWQSRLVTLGQAVRVAMPGRVLAGQAVGVDADGALLVRRPDGETERVLAGDVTLRIEG